MEAETAPGQADPTALTVPRAGRMGWVAGIVLLLGLVVVVSQLGEEERFAALARQANPAWLLLAVAFQSLTYVCAARVWQRVLARHDWPLQLRGLVPLGLAKLFMDQVVPSAGLSGTLLVVRALRRRGVPEGTSAAAVLTGLMAFYLAYSVAVAGALIVLWSRGESSRLVLTVATTFILLAGAILGAVSWLARRQPGRVPAWLARIPLIKGLLGALRGAPGGILRDRRVLLEAVVLQLGIFLLDAATLGACLSAIGAGVGPGPLFASFVTASVVATVTLVPSGVGTFDATCVAMLHLFAVPVRSGLGGVLLFRGFSLLLPLLPGLWLARKEMATRTGLMSRTAEPDPSPARAGVAPQRGLPDEPREQ